MAAAVHRLAFGVCLAVRPWFRELKDIVRVLRGISVPRLSPQLAKALIQAEDHCFGRHPGVDLWSVARALFKTVFCGERQGASTIQQQLVRVASGRYERTAGRKIREIVLAVAVGKYFTRDDVLWLYLVIGYYGYGMAGLQNACEKLRMNPALANANEAASLVARLRYPEPRGDSPAQCARIDGRTRHILAKMARADCRGLTPHAADSAGTVVGAAADA